MVSKGRAVMTKNKIMNILMAVIFILPWSVLITGIPAAVVFWEEEFNKPLFELLYNITFVVAFIVVAAEFIMEVVGIILAVLSYRGKETEKFPVLKVVYFGLCTPLFSLGTFILTFFTVIVFTYGMGV